MSDFYGHVPDDEERAQADLLRQRVGELDEPLRRLGVYVGTSISMGGTGSANVHLTLTADVGDVAFSKRTLSPEVDEVDRQFGEISAAEEINGYIDARENLRRLIDEGVNPFDV
jgi:hypothetical protein